ncbi:MAG: aminoacyl-tRNA hydrolase [Candidatus Babeliales bacterium]
MNKNLKAIIGLGNPGPRFDATRHNIGFAIVDALADIHSAHWSKKGAMEQASITINNQPILLVKPQTFMNNSGEIFPLLAKQGIKAENILVIHDELEKPFGSLAIKEGGSHRGHNGLRSIIDYIGSDFNRLRFGIGRPERKEDVADYVLQKFTKAELETLPEHINQVITLVDSISSF